MRKHHISVFVLAALGVGGTAIPAAGGSVTSTTTGTRATTSVAGQHREPTAAVAAFHRPAGAPQRVIPARHTIVGRRAVHRRAGTAGGAGPARISQRRALRYHRAVQRFVHAVEAHRFFSALALHRYLAAQAAAAPPAQPASPAPPTPTPTVPAATGAADGGVWAELRQCESGGNYAEDDGNGYYGAYQFALGTWAALGYGGLPSQAPPAVQDAAAQALQARSGWGQWPACAARLGL